MHMRVINRSKGFMVKHSRKYGSRVKFHILISLAQVYDSGSSNIMVCITLKYKISFTIRLAQHLIYLVVCYIR